MSETQISPEATANKSSAIKHISRRAFLKLAIPATGAIIGTAIYYKNRGFFDKAGRSVRQGNILNDVWEVIDSQFEKDEILSLAEHDDYDAQWLAGLFETQHFFRVEREEHKRIAFLEITNKCNILRTKHAGRDIASAFEDQSTDFMTLPLPQINSGLNRYLLHASFNIGGDVFVASSDPKSSIRGGLLFEGNKVRVGIPGDYEKSSRLVPYDSYDERKSNSAQIEYFFVLDSRDIQGALDSLEHIPSPSGKKFRNTQEFSSAIVTFYSQDEGAYRTYVMTNYRDFDKSKGTFVPDDVNSFTIPQFASLANDFLNKKHLPGYNRFLVAFPDPSNICEFLAHSQAFSYNEVIENNLEPFLTKNLAVGEYLTDTYHRTLGGRVSSSIRPYKAYLPAYIVTRAS